MSNQENEADLVDVLQEASKRKKVAEIVVGVPISGNAETFPEGEQAKKLPTTTEKVEIKKEEKKE